MYDVIIAGASFAGLSVASELKESDKVLLIEREEIGKVQRSACGAPYDFIESIGCEKSVLQIFDKIRLHTKTKTVDISLKHPYCTFDYEKFCRIMLKKTNAEILKATARQVKNLENLKNSTMVITDKGNFHSKIVVDCTGWEATLASSLEKDYTEKSKLSFGIETVSEYEDEDEDALNFFYDETIIEKGAAWIFPIGNKSRIGVASYVGNTKIVENLKRLLDKYNLSIGKLHGGYFCYCLKNPIVRNIFVVGCSAGQTLPLTGEGIRRCSYFGLEAGKIIQKIIDGKITPRKGQEEYKKIALKNKFKYELLLKMQNIMLKIPSDYVGRISRILFQNKKISGILEEKYKRI